MTPAAAGGKVFSLGTSGRLYALDAAAGKLAWETYIGLVHEEIERAKAAMLADPIRLANPFNFECSLAVAGGVLIAPTYQRKGSDVSLAGFELESGRKLWEVPAATHSQTTPAVWRHGEDEYVLAGSVSGHLRLIEPKSGKVMWDLDGLGPQFECLAPSDQYVLVNVRKADLKAKNDAGKKPMKGYGAIRLDPARPQRAGTLPDEPKYQRELEGDGRVYRRISPRGDGFDVVLPTKLAAEEGGNGMRWFTVNPADGTVSNYATLDLHTPWTSQFWWITDPSTQRIQFNQDSAHCSNRFIWLTLNDGKPRPQGQLWYPMAGKDEDTSGYMAPMQTPILDGLIYLRTSIGTIRCYDLREAAAVGGARTAESKAAAVNQAAPDSPPKAKRDE